MSSFMDHVCVWQKGTCPKMSARDSPRDIPFWDGTSSADKRRDAPEELRGPFQPEVLLLADVLIRSLAEEQAALTRTHSCTV